MNLDGISRFLRDHQFSKVFLLKINNFDEFEQNLGIAPRSPTLKVKINDFDEFKQNLPDNKFSEALIPLARSFILCQNEYGI